MNKLFWWNLNLYHLSLSFWYIFLCSPLNKTTILFYLIDKPLPEPLSISSQKQISCHLIKSTNNFHWRKRIWKSCEPFHPLWTPLRPAFSSWQLAITVTKSLMTTLFFTDLSIILLSFEEHGIKIWAPESHIKLWESTNNQNMSFYNWVAWLPSSCLFLAYYLCLIHFLTMQLMLMSVISKHYMLISIYHHFLSQIRAQFGVNSLSSPVVPKQSNQNGLPFNLDFPFLAGLTKITQITLSSIFKVVIWSELLCSSHIWMKQKKRWCWVFHCCCFIWISFDNILDSICFLYVYWGSLVWFPSMLWVDGWYLIDSSSVQVWEGGSRGAENCQPTAKISTLTHWDWEKWWHFETTFSNQFTSMKIAAFWFKLHGNVFPMAQLTTSNNGFRQCLDAE